MRLLKRCENLYLIALLFLIHSYGQIGHAQSKGEILQAQTLLGKAGYDVGPLDGLWGSKTEKAVREFQKDNVLRVTGILDEATRRLLSVKGAKDELNDESLDIKRESCLGGSLPACLTLVAKRQAGADVGAILSTVEAEYKKRCDTGEAPRCATLGFLYFSQISEKPEMELATNTLKQACDLGSANGCGFLAFFHQTGYGVPEDAEKAAELYGKACKGEDFASCVKLGGMHYDGDDLPQDFGRAIELFEIACSGAYGDGCFRAATVHVLKESDPAKARIKLVRACEFNSKDGCRFLAEMYIDGLGGPQDSPRSLPTLEKACELGHLELCEGLASAYMHGNDKLSIKTSKTRALHFYRKACALGDGPSCETTKRIESWVPMFVRAREVRLLGGDPNLFMLWNSGTLSFSTQVDIIDQKDDYLNVRVGASDTTGWIRQAALTSSRTEIEVLRSKNRIPKSLGLVETCEGPGCLSPYTVDWLSSDRIMGKEDVVPGECLIFEASVLHRLPKPYVLLNMTISEPAAGNLYCMNESRKIDVVNLEK